MSADRGDASVRPQSATSTEVVGREQYMALLAALLGWLFDGAEMGVFSMVGRPAIKDLLKTTDEATIGIHFSIIMASFLVGAATGGVLFGWLGDRIGRVRAMTFSILTYALFTGLCGVVGSVGQLGVLRFIASLGMGGEWALGVALVMEIWPNRSRAFMAGLIGASANAGYMLVGVIGIMLNATLASLTAWALDVGVSQDWVDFLVAGRGWRLLMMCGTAPALLTFLIRLFVPESRRWERGQAAGITNHWATSDLLAVVVGALGPGLIIFLWAERAEPLSIPVRAAGTLAGLAIATVGYIYPVVRFVQRQAATTRRAHPLGPIISRMLLGAGLSGVALLGTWGAAQWIPSWADKLSDGTGNVKEYAQICVAIGAIVGTILAALAGDWIGRRWTYFVLCVLSLISAVWLYQFHDEFNASFMFATFLVGASTASFYGWLPLYLPRAVSHGDSRNVSGIRLQLRSHPGRRRCSADRCVVGRRGYPAACTTMSMIYLAGMGLIWLAPETKGLELPE